jgi:hypothetical protein
MGLSISVTGAGDFHKLAAALHQAARKDLALELDRGLRKSTNDMADAITAKSDDYMPEGYERVFKASLHYKTEVRNTYDHRITLVVKARGAKGHDRQVEQLERGEFRAPNWGRWRKRRGINRGRHKLRNQWHTQRVRARFATEPAEGARPAVIANIDAAMARVINKIEKAT